MRKLCMLIFLALIATSVAMAQSQPGNGTFSGTQPAAGTLPYGVSNTSTGAAGFNAALGQDVLGAHNGYGRGCVMCHAPHGGALGNNAPAGNAGPFPNNKTIIGGGLTAGSDTGNGTGGPLWGENLAPYYGATVTFTGKYTVALPTSASAASGGAATVLLCLSCHDGALTKPAMMTGSTVEALPIVGGSAPTLFGLTTGNSALQYVNEHPVGVDASTVWGCNQGASTTINPGSGSCSPLMGTFMSNNPASFWNLISSYSGKPSPGLATFGTSGQTGYTVNGVTCTTCHNQHQMTEYTAQNGTTFPTMFFIRGAYMPSTGGNSVAQFCRNCHNTLSNEWNGVKGVGTT